MLCSWMALHQKGCSIRHFATFLSVLCTLFLVDISRRSERQVTTAVVGLVSAEACPASSVRSMTAEIRPIRKQLCRLFVIDLSACFSFPVTFLLAR